MNNLSTLTVYLGSSGHARAVFQQSAADLGTLIGASGKKLVYGGMDAGLMGELARNALQAGGAVSGIIPQKLKDSERILQNLTETILVHDLWERKRKMFHAADAIISLPGGFGTLDESLEVLYWAHLGLHRKPLLLVNIEDYWNPMIAYLKTLPDFDARYLIVTSTINDTIPALAAWTPPPVTVKLEQDLPHFEDEITRKTTDSIMIDQASIQNSYYAACALGLKQLGRHHRPIGFLNTNGQFDHLLDWFKAAERERFITPKCLQLFSVSDDETKLRALLNNQADITINLHAEKWGERREKERP